MWPGPAHAGNEKYLTGLWTIVASGPQSEGRGDGRRDHAEGYETESDVLTRVYQDLIVQPETRA